MTYNMLSKHMRWVFRCSSALHLIGSGQQVGNGWGSAPTVSRSKPLQRDSASLRDSEHPTAATVQARASSSHQFASLHNCHTDILTVCDIDINVTQQRI